MKNEVIDEVVKIKKGQWFSLCCWRDLTKADEDMEYDVEDGVQVWDTKTKALIDLRGWTLSPPSEKGTNE